MSYTDKFYGFPSHLEKWYNDGGQDEQKGTCEDIGFHALFLVGERESKLYKLDKTIEGYIVREDSQGFVYFEEYESKEELKKAWNSIKEIS